MKVLQLYKDNQPLLGSDGIMHVDGRFNMQNIKAAVKARNGRFSKNFPWKVADSFTFWFIDSNTESKRHYL